MLELRKIEQDILANGKFDSRELEVLRRRVNDGLEVGRPEADFLVALHKRVQHRTPSIDQFFYRAVKDHLLMDGRTTVPATRRERAPSCTSKMRKPMPYRLKAIAFDLDAASLGSLREALAEWEIEVVNGATAASLMNDNYSSRPATTRIPDLS